MDVTRSAETFNQNFHTVNRDMHPHTNAHQLFRNQTPNAIEPTRDQQIPVHTGLNHVAIPATPRLAPSTPIRSNDRINNEIPMRLQTPLAQSSTQVQPSSSPPNNWVFGGVLKRIGKAQTEYNRHKPY